MIDRTRAERGAVVTAPNGNTARLTRPILQVYDHRRPKRDGYGFGARLRLNRGGGTHSFYGVTARWKVHVLLIETPRGRMTFHLHRYLGSTRREVA